MIRKNKTARRPSKSKSSTTPRYVKKPATRTSTTSRSSKSTGAAAPRRAPPKPIETLPAELPAAPELSAKRRRELRGDAHGLEPLVQVGHGGITEAVVRAASRALFDHELIKVRLHEPEDKQAMANEIALATRSSLCGLVGHTVILYRQKPKQKGVSGVARTAIKKNREKKGGRR